VGGAGSAKSANCSFAFLHFTCTKGVGGESGSKHSLENQFMRLMDGK
jgi:hypothetical protein